MTGPTMTIQGGPELAQALREVGDDMGKARAKNALRRALVTASEPMRQAAAANAPDDPNTQSKIGVVASSSLSARQKRDTGGRVPPDIVRTYVGEQAGSVVGLLNEFGTDPRVQKSTERETGRIIAKPWLRPAFDSTAPAMLGAIVPAVWDEIKKAAERARKKQARALKKGLAT